MNKQTFLIQLRNGLFSLPQKEREERINFYSEMIDDRMEEGLTEDAAIAEIGEVDTIVSQILADHPCGKSAERSKKKYNARTITFLAIGAPVWLSLIIAGFAVALSLFVSLWAVILSLWSAFIVMIIGAVGGAIATIAYLTLGSPLIALAMFSISLVCAGISILLFFACKIATNAAIRLTKKLVTRQPK